MGGEGPPRSEIRKKCTLFFLVFLIWTTTTGIRGNLRGPRRSKKYEKALESKKEKEEGNKKSDSKVGTHRVRQPQQGDLVVKW